jgi:RNA polymerase sigma factor (sigma-70 family)
MNPNQDIPVTTTLLLSRLGDQHDEQAWEEFDQRFRAVILSTSLRLGLNKTDAEEATQETMLQAFRDYRLGKYDRTQGRLSSWLIGIARNRIIDLIRMRKKVQGGSGIELHEDQFSQRSINEAFDQALERQIFEQAWEWMRTNSQSADGSIRAFELTALRGVPVSEAAEQCSMTVDQVYVARSRVSARLRDAVERFDRAYRDGL